MRSFWCVWLPWFLTNVVAVATALAALWAVIHVGVSGLIPEVVFAPVWASGLLWVFAGALIGGGQWLVLRQRLPGAGWWKWASALGTAVGVAAMFLAFIATGGEVEATSVPDLAVIGAAGGVAVGVAQWLVLRRLVRRAGWWVLASAAGAGGGVLSYSLLPGDETRFPSLLPGWGAAGAAYGVVTGTALLWLLRTIPAGRRADVVASELGFRQTPSSSPSLVSSAGYARYRRPRRVLVCFLADR